MLSHLWRAPVPLTSAGALPPALPRGAIARASGEQHDVDYYARFGLELGASDEEIKKRHKELALKLHPDKNTDDPEAEQRFKEMQETFSFLSNPESRAMIDTWALERLKKQKLVDDMERKRKKREWEELEEERCAPAARICLRVFPSCPLSIPWGPLPRMPLIDCMLIALSPKDLQRKAWSLTPAL